MDAMTDEGSLHVSNKTIFMTEEGALTLLAATEDMDQDIKLVVIDTLTYDRRREQQQRYERLHCLSGHYS